MSLEDKLGPIAKALGPVGRAYHRIDDEVHRYYEKIVKRAEDDGYIGRAGLALGAYAASIGFAAILPEGADGSRATIPIIIGSAGILILSPATLTNLLVQMHANMTGNHDGIREAGDQKTISNPFMYRAWRFVRGQRLTMLATGCTALVGGGVSFLNGIQDQDQNAIQTAYFSSLNGLYLITQASSIYFLDKKPELLDRQPAWKQALDGVRHYLAPAPTPALVPVPVDGR